MDSPIVKTLFAQGDHIGLAHPIELIGEFFGIEAQCLVGRAQVGQSPIGGDVVHKGVGFLIIRQSQILGDLCPEVISMVPDSVNPMVGGRYDHSQHLSLAAT